MRGIQQNPFINVLAFLLEEMVEEEMEEMEEMDEKVLRLSMSGGEVGQTVTQAVSPYR